MTSTRRRLVLWVLSALACACLAVWVVAGDGWFAAGGAEFFLSLLLVGMFGRERVREEDL